MVCEEHINLYVAIHEGVLILVLMEYGLRVCQDGCLDTRYSDVLILVLMEYGLRDTYYPVLCFLASK